MCFYFHKFEQIIDFAFCNLHSNCLRTCNCNHHNDNIMVETSRVGMAKMKMRMDQDMAGVSVFNQVFKSCAVIVRQVRNCGLLVADFPLRQRKFLYKS